MYLRALIPVNWGTLQPAPFRFSGATLLTGASGAGKSMILDAVQAVLTAGHSKVARFNIAQSESGDKRSRDKTYRTLEGYALGQLSQTFQRKTSNTWVAGVFEASGSEMANPFTAVVGITATLERDQAVLNRLSLYLIQGVVKLDDLTVVNEQGQRIARPLSEASGYFQDRFGAEKVDSFGDSKGEYLQSLYGWCESRKHISPGEALQSARALVKACAYRPVNSVNDLIRGEILEEVDMKEIVDRIASIMRDIRGLNEEGQRLGRSLIALESIAADCRAARSAYVEIRTLNLAYAIQRVLVNEKAMASAREDRGRQYALLDQKRAELEVLKVSRTGLDGQLRAVTTQLERIPAAAQEKILKAALAQADAEGTRQGGELVKAIRTIAQRHIQAQQVLERLATEQELIAPIDRAMESAKRMPAPLLDRLLKELSHRLSAGEPLADLQRSVEQVGSADANLVIEIVRPLDGLAAKVQEHSFGLRQQLLRKEDEVDELRKRVAAIDAGHFDMPATVRAALERMRAELPKDANPSIVAEHVEPRADSPWIDAIEGYLGNNRFAILVEPAYEVAAIKLLRDPLEVRGWPQPKVVQVSRLQRDARGATVVEGSILEELQIKKPIVKTYLTALCGNVLKVEGLEQLKIASRGITLSGHVASNYAVSRFSPVGADQRAFGVSGRERALVALKERLVAAEADKVRLKGRVEFIQSISAALAQLDPANPLPAFNARVVAEQAAEAARRSLALLDLSDALELRAQENALKERIAAVEADTLAMSREIGSVESAITGLNLRIKVCEDQIPEREAALADAQRIVTELAAADASVVLGKLQASAQEHAQSRPTGGAESPERLAITALGRLQGAIADLRSGLRDYNRNARAQEAIRHELTDKAEDADQPETYQQFLAVARQTNDQLRSQREHTLAGIKDELEGAEEQFNSVFTSVFAHKMCNAIEEGVRTLKLLNVRIERFRFGHDTYKIVWDMLPQYEAYANFFKYVSDRGEDLAKGQTIFSLPLSPDLARVRDELKTLLLSEDANAADRRLKEIMDWRNYRKYDIIVTRADTGSRTPLSTFGTGSGGETQTPFYVVRASVLASALRHDNGSPTHLSMLLLDEAFSAMDGERSRKVMDLLRDTFGLQVICAMPTKNCGAVRGLFSCEYQAAMHRVDATGPARVTVCTRVDLKREAISSLIDKARRGIVEDVYGEYNLPVPPPEAPVTVADADEDAKPARAVRKREAESGAGF